MVTYEVHIRGGINPGALPPIEDAGGSWIDKVARRLPYGGVRVIKHIFGGETSLRVTGFRDKESVRRFLLDLQPMQDANDSDYICMVSVWKRRGLTGFELVASALDPADAATMLR